MEKEKTSKKQRNAERAVLKRSQATVKKAMKKLDVEKREAAKARELLPIGGKCPDCGLHIRSNSMEKHRAGMSHIMRAANKNVIAKKKVGIYK